MPSQAPSTPLCFSAALVFIYFTAAAALTGGGDVRKYTPSLKGCRLNDGSVNKLWKKKRALVCAWTRVVDWWKDARVSQEQKEFFHSVAHFAENALKDSDLLNADKPAANPAYLFSLGQL